MGDASKAVAWRWRTPHGWVVGKLKSSAHAEPLYSQATVDELRAEVAELKRVRDTIMSAFNNAQIRQFIEKHGEPVPIVARAERAEAALADLRNALEHIARVGLSSRQKTKRTQWIIARAKSAVNGDDQWTQTAKPKGYHDALERTRVRLVAEGEV